LLRLHWLASTTRAWQRWPPIALGRADLRYSNRIDELLAVLAPAAQLAIAFFNPNLEFGFAAVALVVA
jgi:hypothetical protein